MTERIFLLLLLPYAPLLIWALRKLKFAHTPTIILLLITTAYVWAVLYVSYSMDIFPTDSGRAFDSVEYIMRDVDNEWLLRYVADRFGGVLGLAYFFICWCLAKYMSGRESNAKKAVEPTQG